MNVAFAGTPRFGAWVLADLLDLGRVPSVVVTQPDRRAGRGKRLVSPPVAELARSGGLACIQTADVNEPATAEALHAAGVEVLAVASFGQIFGARLLDAFMCVNVHASLLPAYRGAAPINRAIANGEETTGITIMRMVQGLDEGPWAARTSVSVSPRDDAGSVGRALALLGALALDQVLHGLRDGTVVWRAQEGSPSYASKLAPADLVIDSRRSASRVHDQVRALAPLPAASLTTCSGLAVKVYRTWPYGVAESSAVPQCAAQVAGVPGRLACTKDRLFLGCGEGAVELLEVQPAGRSRMRAAEFLRGYSSRLGDRIVDRPSATGSKEP